MQESSFKYHKLTACMSLLFTLGFMFSFNFGTLLLFTTFNVYALTILPQPYRWRASYRNTTLATTVFMTHWLQLAMWLNPGPIFSTFNLFSFAVIPITLETSLLIDFNCLISTPFVIAKAPILVSRLWIFVKTTQEKAMGKMGRWERKKKVLFQRSEMKLEEESMKMLKRWMMIMIDKLSKYTENMIDKIVFKIADLHTIPVLRRRAWLISCYSDLTKIFSSIYSPRFFFYDPAF